MGREWTRDLVLRATATPALLLFTFVVLSQSAHLLEHVAQMVQIHLLGLAGPDARGIVGQLDIEWVHFIWNSVVVLALAALLVLLGPNRWLVLVTLFASWHLIEHGVIMRTYLTTGITGSPGLLAHGGIVAGGLPLSRPDLHFVYNLLETAGLCLAWFYSLARTAPSILHVSPRLL